LGALLLRGGEGEGRKREGKGGKGKEGRERERMEREGGRKGKGEDDCYSKRFFRPWLLWKSNRKGTQTYRMAPISMTLSDL